MRPLLLIPLIIIAPLLIFSLLGSVTGDSMSAVVLGLTLMLVAGAWFAGAPLHKAQPSADREARQ